MAIEARGDFRNIVWAALACPTRLIGFDFTGGARLLTDIVPDDGKITHLFGHTKRLGRILNLEVTDGRIKMDLLPSPKGKVARIGISFAGSQTLRRLPAETGLALLRDLAQSMDAEIWYIQSPQETVYTDELLERELGDRLRLFSGNFEQYYAFLKTLDCYIGMDSGGGHLCSMFGIASVIIFGTQQPSYCSPVGGHPLLCIENSRQLACRPCNGVTCVNNIYQECLQEINFDAIKRFVKDSITQPYLVRQGTTNV